MHLRWCACPLLFPWPISSVLPTPKLNEQDSAASSWCTRSTRNLAGPLWASPMLPGTFGVNREEARTWCHIGESMPCQLPWINVITFGFRCRTDGDSFVPSFSTLRIADGPPVRRKALCVRRSTMLHIISLCCGRAWWHKQHQKRNIWDLAWHMWRERCETAG